MEQKPNEKFKNSSPLYLKIYHDLKDLIINAKLLPHEKIPSENDLRKQYGVSRFTIQHVFQLLVDEGLVVRRKGLGSFVKPYREDFDTNENPEIIHLGGINRPEILLTRFHYKFARRVAELTYNRINIKVHHSSELGSATEQIHQVADGRLEMFGAAVDWLELLEPNWGITNLPFLFRDLNHLKTYVKSPINEAIKKQLLDRRAVRVIADNWYRPSRLLISRKPCFELDDIRGVRMAIQPIPVYRLVWETLGTSPVEVHWGRLAESFEQNMVDATDANCDTMKGFRFHHYAPYATYTNHLYSRACIVMSEKCFQSFRSDIQGAILQAAYETGEDYSATLLKMFKNDKRELISEGARFIETDIRPFRKLISPLSMKIDREGNWTRGLYKKIKDL